MHRAFFRHISSSPQRTAPIRRENTKPAAIYFWSPGYKIPQTVKLPDGTLTEKKVFVPTSNPMAALSFLLKHYGSQDLVLKHKHDIHPGHVALAVQDKYLSIGMEDDLTSLRPNSEHKVTFSQELYEDIAGFERFPHCVDLHSLDTQRMADFIETYLTNPEKVYSILGSRLNFANGESCATIVHKALLNGGLQQLLTLYTQTISSRSILTPHGFKEICDLAKSTEHTMHPEIKPVSEAFQKRYAQDIQNIRSSKKLEMPHDYSQSSSPSTKPGR